MAEMSTIWYYYQPRAGAAWVQLAISGGQGIIDVDMVDVLFRSVHNEQREGTMVLVMFGQECTAACALFLQPHVGASSGLGHRSSTPWLSSRSPMVQQAGSDCYMRQFFADHEHQQFRTSERVDVLLLRSWVLHPGDITTCPECSVTCIVLRCYSFACYYWMHYDHAARGSTTWPRHGCGCCAINWSLRYRFA